MMPGEGAPALHRRALRRLLTPWSRRWALMDDGRPFAGLGDPELGESRPRAFMIVLPGTEEMVCRSSSLLTEHCRLCLVLNGHSQRQARLLAASGHNAASIRLRTLPGFPVKHGTAVTLLLTHARENLLLLDADCFVRDPAVLELPRFEADEYLAAPDHPHFYNLNEATGFRFPRTHFLMFNVGLVREVMARHRISAEKYLQAPRRLDQALASIGYGAHNYPRSYLRHFDTLLLLMAMAHHDGLRIRWLPAEASQLVHRKHHAVGLESLVGSRPVGGDRPDPG